MPTHHEIEIHLVNGNVRVDKSKILRVGDTVRYSSPDGKARVFFPAGSPYRLSRISDTHKHKVQKPRKEKYEYQCFVTPRGKKTEMGWAPENPKAGGEHEVIPG